MPGLDRMLDPVTGDYIDAPGGEYEETLTAAPALYHQMKTPLGRWWGDLDAGSLLHLLRQRGADEPTVRFAEDAALQALDRLVVDGLIESPAAAASADRRGRMHLSTSCVDIQTGQPLKLPVIGGR